MDKRVKEFFDLSDIFDRAVTRQLSHIRENWELTWDHTKKKYESEGSSYAELINELVIELSYLDPPSNYHNNEDALAEYCQSFLNWKIQKVGNRWEGADYACILEQGSFKDFNQRNLCVAACGRVKAAIEHKQYSFDDMEEFHRKILATVIAIILYRRGDCS